MSIKLYRPVKGERNKDWRMTQAFGLRPEVYGPMGFKGHMGLDYAGPKPGDKINIYSASEGVATIGRDPKGYGNFVKVISNFDGKSYTILYGHLDSITCKNGPIKCFDEIGIMGTTGFSSGVHLHFEIKDGTQMSNGYKGRIDPAPYITQRETTQDVETIATETSHLNDDIQVLISNKIFNGEVGSLDKRMLTLLGRVYKACK